jgi:hypothetical protein
MQFNSKKIYNLDLTIKNTYNQSAHKRGPVKSKRPTKRNLQPKAKKPTKRSLGGH